MKKFGEDLMQRVTGVAVVQEARSKVDIKTNLNRHRVPLIVVDWEVL